MSQTYQKPHTHEMLAEFTRSYALAMLWANTNQVDPVTEEITNETVDPFAWQTGNADWPIEAFDEKSRDEIREDCRDFFASNYRDLRTYVKATTLETHGEEYAWQAAGHDFALTRNGHGAGFWDRGLGDVGDRLSEACRPYGSCNAWTSDDDEQVHLY